jgi:uncharacterized paraquat-inducible protein A
MLILLMMVMMLMKMMTMMTTTTMMVMMVMMMMMMMTKVMVTVKVVMVMMMMVTMIMMMMTMMTMMMTMLAVQRLWWQIERRQPRPFLMLETNSTRQTQKERGNHGGYQPVEEGLRKATMGKAKVTVHTEAKERLQRCWATQTPAGLGKTRAH